MSYKVQKLFRPEPFGQEEDTAKVFVVGGGNSYANWLPSTTLTSYEEADLLLFTGGADISPSIYGDVRHKTTSPNIKRDDIEVAYMRRAIEDKKKILGICRGAQLACAIAGGKLIQHQEDMHNIHPIRKAGSYISRQGRTNLQITSYHHQAMFPFNLPPEDYTVLAYATNHSRYHLNGNNEEMHPEVEVEICHFPAIQALGIQGHPEMMWNEHKGEYAETFKYLQSLYRKLLTNQL